MIIFINVIFGLMSGFIIRFFIQEKIISTWIGIFITLVTIEIIKFIGGLPLTILLSTILLTSLLIGIIIFEAIKEDFSENNKHIFASISYKNEEEEEENNERIVEILTELFTSSFSMIKIEEEDKNLYILNVYPIKEEEHEIVNFLKESGINTRTYTI